MADTYIDHDQLLNDGTVLLVNLAVLWPRGLALTVDKDTDTGESVLEVQDFGEYNCLGGDAADMATDRFRSLLEAEDRRERRISGRADG